MVLFWSKKKDVSKTEQVWTGHIEIITSPNLTSWFCSSLKFVLDSLGVHTVDMHINSTSGQRFDQRLGTMSTAALKMSHECKWAHRVRFLSDLAMGELRQFLFYVLQTSDIWFVLVWLCRFCSLLRIQSWQWRSIVRLNVEDARWFHGFTGFETSNTSCWGRFVVPLFQRFNFLRRCKI